MRPFYIFCKSGDSKTLFPDNTPWSFTIQLPEIVKLDGAWRCSLVDFHCFPTGDKNLYILCDIIEESFVKDTRLPVLQHIFEDEKQQALSKCYDAILTFSINKTTLHTISFKLIDANSLKLANLNPDLDSRCILHFTKEQ